MKIIFMGTPEFSVPSLSQLINEFEVSAVFTQPDRPKGRGKNLAMSAVKQLAVTYNIPVYQPLRLRNNEEMIEMIKNLKPDFIVVVAFGQILPKEVLSIPKYGCINLHASLLPKYRGAAPINWCVINGESKSGNTTMLMDVGLDTGDILLTEEMELPGVMSAGELHDILMNSGAQLLVKTINGIVSNEIEPVKQENEFSSYASKLGKEMAKINWECSNVNIHNFIRGLNPWPIAYTHYENIVMKIYKSKVINEQSNKMIGSIIEVSKEGLKVATGSGVLLIEEIQFPGKKPLKVRDYIIGNKINEGSILK
ncbi:methionyl-tRNA formyltransferase [Clostridium sp. CM028]|uniref:methionyl-tRNA formyltransferase n=1 Tax=unclassified Clostridium TaxID=2614128 RepID=UPI001C0DAA17|nr:MULTISPECIES: methionyl-tRNA formyltransferase [unclassified Clostridium]MBU3091595.1 methionyl-tRNA formyltransferase [Clostridium sp. CF011]MBW9144140.1 methionyl-tRNA formyltransferase [Clostridium sp. CM027]MBW9147549.1 methionyl-tRNA formyltransferase [Clostridium sp. CM028]UVE41217.1 methionyl-tRNA formyltransferase [Clostridium sp. CM027]WAG70213.1 methionyl-tRNA formyltransferase [Clostridium sp. CF011]